MIEFLVAGVVAAIITFVVWALVALVYWLGWTGAFVDLFLVLWFICWKVFE